MGTLALTNRWAVLALIFVSRMSMALQFQSIPPLSSFLIQEQGWSYGQLGTLVGLFMLPGVVLALPGGLLGQRFGDKRVTLAGLGLLTLGAALFGMADGFAGAFAARLVGGLGILLLNVESTKITTDWFAGKEIATAMGIMLSAWPLGIALSLSSLGALAAASSWRFAIEITAAASAVCALLFAALYADPPRAASPPPAACASREPGASPRVRADGRRRLWLIAPREVRLIAAVGCLWMLTNASFIVFLSFAPAFLVAQGATVSEAGVTVGLTSWASIPAVPLGGWIMDRVGRLYAFIAVGALVSALTIAMVTVGWAVPLWTLLFGLVSGLWASAILTLAGQVLSPESRHTGFGVFYTVFYAGLAGVPPLAGVLQDATGSARASLWLAAGIMALALPALGGFHLLRRQGQPSAA